MQSNLIPAENLKQNLPNPTDRSVADEEGRFVSDYPTAKCPVFVRQVVAVESIVSGEESVVEPMLEEIDFDLDEDELND